MRAVKRFRQITTEISHHAMKYSCDHLQMKNKDLPLNNSNPPFIHCLNTSFVFTNYHPRHCNASYNRAFIVNWSLSDIMTLKLVNRESESPWT